MIHPLLRNPDDGSIDDPIRRFQSEMDALKSQAEALRPNLKACQDAIQRSDSNGIVAIRAHSGNPRIEIITHRKRLDDTVPLFRELAKEGLHSDKRKPFEDKNLAGILGMREYKFGPTLSVIAMIFSVSDSSPGACRLVQTGVEEVPVYEMKCED